MELDALLKHQDWAQSLAARLLDDASASDDILQEVWLAARKNPPKNSESVTGWIASVVRNLATMRVRTETRRRQREARVGALRAAEAAQTENVLDQIEVQRRVVDALLELEEPDRTVIALRCYEELNATQIGQRLGVTAATVRSRLQRGIRRLREKLEAESTDDPRSWAFAIMPFALRAPIDPIAVGASKPAVAVWAKWTAVPAVLVAAIVALSSGSRDASPAPADVPGGAVAGVTGVEELAPLPNDRSHDAPIGGEPTGTVSTDSQLFEQPPVKLAGLVRDIHGDPVPGLDVRVAGRPAGPFGLTDAEGRFSFMSSLSAKDPEPGMTSDRLVVDSDRYATVRSGSTSEKLQESAMIIVAPAIEFVGTVLDARSQPLTDVLFEFHVSVGELVDYPSNDDLSRTEQHHFRYRSSEADGRFSFRIARIEGVPVRITKSRFRTATYAVEEIPDREVDIVLEENPERVTIFGFVRKEDLKPAEGAVVHYLNETAVCGDDGSFELSVPQHETEAPLTAILEGVQPAVVERFGADQSRRRANKPVELTLGGSALVLDVRVIDHAGEPLVNWDVGLIDPTIVSWNHSPGTAAEQLTMGGSLPRPVTNGDGRFRFGGLSDRPYTVWVGQKRDQLRIDSVPTHPGGAELVIVIPEGAYLPPLTGRVVDARGIPVDGVRVSVSRDFVVDGNTTTSGGSSAETDDLGAFVLDRVPSRGVYLSVTGSCIVTTEFSLSDLGLEEGENSTENHDLVVQRTVSIRYYYDPAVESGTQVRIECLDAAGERLACLVRSGSGWTTSSSLSAVRGATPVFEVSERIERIRVWSGATVVCETEFTASEDGVIEIRGR